MNSAPQEIGSAVWTPALVTAIAAAVAERLPVAETLVPAEPVIGGTPPWPPKAAAAVRARLTGQAEADLIVVVDAELVDYLKKSPVGELDLLAALAPTIAAAGAAAGAVVDQVEEIPAVAPLGQAGTSAPVAVALAVDGHHRGTVLVRAIEISTPHPRNTTHRAGLEMLRDIEMEVTVEIGRTRMTVRELLELAPGQVVELDRAAGSPADLLVNGTLLARGEIVVVGEDFGIRITEIVSSGAPESVEANA